MMKFGIELAKNGKTSVTMYDDPNKAMSEAEEIGGKLKDNETLMLFTAECDDVTGKLATNQFNVVKTWSTASFNS